MATLLYQFRPLNPRSLTFCLHPRRGDTVTKSLQGELFATCNMEIESKKLSWVSFPDNKRLAGEPPSVILTHAKFGELNVGLFKKTMTPVEQVLKDANIKKDDIDEPVDWLLAAVEKLNEQQKHSAILKAQKEDEGAGPE
ncbi:hypothetical protein BT96DRAFT_1000441 [Gymnopus androsaceus JB14]|uniref:Uncharacterized protein n=1 Tax=Gymnopus androsaceus JB14 TaxID=1447944 RepID=A0A6A4H3T4_9AGAR|nr:hypothetical protein BT96DRAFT_1000441 [Gymnopus androsaceus JB14]